MRPAPIAPDLAELVVGHLIDLGSGVCSVTLERAVAEPDPVVRDILTGLRLLHEDLEHHRAESAQRMNELTRSEALSRTVLDGTADAIVTVDERSIIRGWNRAAAALFGHAAADAIGEHVETRMPGVIGHFKTNRAQREGESRRKDGSPVTVAMRVSELVVGSERLLVAVVRDLTEDKLAEATLGELNRKLVDASREAGRAEVAAGVLHNVGNVLNSVNVSSAMIADGIRKSETATLVKLAQLVEEHEGDLGRFFTDDPRGRRLPAFLRALGEQMTIRHEKLLAELTLLHQNVEHINSIVAMHQNHARGAAFEDVLAISDLVEEAIAMDRAAYESCGVALVRDYDSTPAFLMARHKLVQILVNLVRNARHAVRDAQRDDGCVRVAIRNAGVTVRVSVCDNGVGIRPEHFGHLFEQGFTTKPRGHGHGLHSSAATMKELGGSIVVHSDGPGLGASFTLEIPVRLRHAA